MAYRRRQAITRASTFKEEIHYPSDEFDHNSISSSSSSSSSLAAQAIRASATHHDSSHSSAFAGASSNFSPGHMRSKSFAGENVFKSESKSGFWGVLARKAKAILEEDDIAIEEEPSRFQPINTSNRSQEPCQSTNCDSKKTDNPAIRKGLDAISTSLNQLGDTFEKAYGEGRTIVENKTADIIQETRKLQIRKKGNNTEGLYPAVNNQWQQPNIQSPEPNMQTHHETQLKASRDVAMATAAKAKLLLRELKTIKADLAFAKERCAQLEEENKILRENREKGDNRADDDLIRLQLETLLAEKARLAHENSIYARENRFLREIVEYHQLTMQDVVYLDEGMEEVTEVYPISTSPEITKTLSNSVSPRSPTSPSSPMEVLPAVPPPPIQSKQDKDHHDKDSDEHPTSSTTFSEEEEEEEEEGTKTKPLPSTTSSS
ncbi:actin cytoskeleton-regulatory complex protein pan1 [Cucumis melo var. makuwa]|uniref:Actin cytoskeleton-regulatory complex protein pan1 n=2 Tax=Cucumis melo TaxID=3656 RepID=A0A5D3C4F3_CUCMM|nr:uncharacterized protein LOC103501490 isoform X1 [Cucumis melo]TYK06210.1 actin cytoskeleton-regulatory complex protein pan1 [Cucumis melo var. makuwa]